MNRFRFVIVAVLVTISLGTAEGRPRETPRVTAPAEVRQTPQNPIVRVIKKLRLRISGQGDFPNPPIPCQANCG